MSEIVKIVGFSGIGDFLLAAKCAHFVCQAEKYPYLYACCRDEVFSPIQFVFDGIFKLEQLPEEYSERVLFDNDLINKLKGNCEEYYVCKPDFLHRNIHAFNYHKYNTNLNLLKTTRLLTHRFQPRKGNVFIGLMSTTNGYLYKYIPNLVISLANSLTDYTFHFSVVDKWANIDIKWGELESCPKNLAVYRNQRIEDQINVLRHCEYGIYTDCGPNHLAYEYGQTRLILDPQFDKQIWNARWKESTEDCININTSVRDIVELIKHNLETPQTTLISRQAALNIIRRTNYNPSWSGELLFKF